MRAGEALSLPCHRPGEVLARRHDFDPLKALQSLQVLIARDEVVCPGFDRTLEEHVIARISADDFDTSIWENKDDVIGILKEGE